MPCLVSHLQKQLTAELVTVEVRGELCAEDLREGFSCISRLFWGPKCVGTAFRVGHHAETKHGLILAARHCCLEGSSLLEVLGAFGGELTLLASFPAYDFIVFKGEPGPCLHLATAEGRYGFPGALSLVSYPQAIDMDLKLAADDEPTVTAGVVAQVDAPGAMVAATYEGGFKLGELISIICRIKIHGNFICLFLLHQAMDLSRLKSTHTPSPLVQDFRTAQVHQSSETAGQQLGCIWVRLITWSN